MAWLKGCGGDGNTATGGDSLIARAGGNRHSRPIVIAT
jgi:hypothetical protein